MVKILLSTLTIIAIQTKHLVSEKLHLNTLIANFGEMDCYYFNKNIIYKALHHLYKYIYIYIYVYIYIYIY